MKIYKEVEELLTPRLAVHHSPMPNHEQFLEVCQGDSGVLLKRQMSVIGKLNLEKTKHPMQE